MSSWIDCIYDPRALVAIYGPDIPGLDDVKFFRMQLESEVKFSVEPREYPKNPPKKWQELKYNRTQIEFAASDILEFRVSGFECDCRIQLQIWREGEGIRLRGVGQLFSFEILARFVFIRRVVGYMVDVGTE